jgi:hypothetical protein
MKHLLNNLSEEEKNKIREQHTGGMEVNSKNFNKLTESKLGNIKPLINEQVTLLTINPKNILFSTGDTTKQIKLKGIDPKTKQPLVLKYNIKGEYSFFNFDVFLRNIKRYPSGDLFAEAQPSNSFAAKAMKALVPKKNQTADGWLNVFVPNQKINDAINKLVVNKGAEAEIDAGQGIKINLTLAQ